MLLVIALLIILGMRHLFISAWDEHLQVSCQMRFDIAKAKLKGYLINYAGVKEEIADEYVNDYMSKTLNVDADCEFNTAKLEDFVDHLLSKRVSKIAIIK